jgi:hypothetical protein
MPQPAGEEERAGISEAMWQIAQKRFAIIHPHTRSADRGGDERGQDMGQPLLQWHPACDHPDGEAMVVPRYANRPYVLGTRPQRVARTAETRPHVRLV